MEFDKVLTEQQDGVVITFTTKEDVAETEQIIRVAKEKARAIVSVLPCKSLPNIMTIHFCIFWINMTPITLGYSNIYCLRGWICRQKVDVKKWCKLKFGANAESHKDQEMTNKLKQRTRPEICPMQWKKD